jgi:hypothetical protein
MKMTLERFSKSVDLISENFGFKIQNEEWLEMLFTMANKFSDEDIKFGFQEMCKMTKVEWSKEYGYNGKPSFADWINFFTLKDKLRFDEKKKIEEKRLYLNAKRNIVEKVERYYEDDDNIVNERLTMILGDNFGDDNKNIKMIEEKEVKKLLSNLTQKI